MSIREHLIPWAKRTKRDGVTLWFAGKHPETPWYAKALGVFVVAYALSPIDLIPDFIPVLGYVDDILLLPALILLTVKLLPTSVLTQCRLQADKWMAEKQSKPISKAGALMVILLSTVIDIALGLWVIRWLFA